MPRPMKPLKPVCQTCKKMLPHALACRHGELLCLTCCKHAHAPIASKQPVLVS